MSGALVVNSHVARGSVGGRASTFALERAGLPVVFLPTVILPWHPGHGPASRIVTGGFEKLVADLAGAPWLGDIGGLLSGYLGHADQAVSIAQLVGALKLANPQALYLCDPVIGDDTGLYVPEATAAAIASELLPLADIATPNASELAWLTGREIHDRATATAAAADLGVSEVVVTSVPGEPAGATGVALITPGKKSFARHDILPGVPRGTGDLLAGLYFAQRLQRQTAGSALENAVRGTVAMAHHASRLGTDELPLAQFERADSEGVQSLLTVPTVTIE